MQFRLRCEFLETRDNPSGPEGMDDTGGNLPPSTPPAQTPPPTTPPATPPATPPSPPLDPLPPPGW